MSADLSNTQAAPVSAVIVSYFTGPVLARSISSLREQPEIGEIFLVDNGNWEGAVEAAIAAAETEEGSGAPVTVISGHGNVGFATACNLGARCATRDYLLFLNPDAIMEPGGVAQLLRNGRTLSRPWMIGPKLVDPDGGEQQGGRRATLTPWRAFVEATGLYRLAPQHPYFRRFNLHNDPCPGELCPTPTISGACFLLSREDYFSIDGMDERYFLHVEDVDFCLRFGNAGGAVYYNPKVVVLHFKSSSRVNAMRVERHAAIFPNAFLRRLSASFYVACLACLVDRIRIETRAARRHARDCACRDRSFIARAPPPRARSRDPHPRALSKSITTLMMS
ncbi:MAG: glycosyltransferase family 2 protein [Pseudomonadota bacterium]